MLSESQVVEGLVDNGCRRHGKHTAQEDAVHLGPTEQMAYENTQHRHAEDGGTGGDDRRGAHLQDFLKGEVESKGKEQEHHTKV